MWRRSSRRLSAGSGENRGREVSSRWGEASTKKKIRTVRWDSKAPECRITDMEKHILNRVNQMGSTAPVALLLALTCTLCVNVLLHLRLHACTLSVSRRSDPIFTSSVKKTKPTKPKQNKATTSTWKFKAGEVATRTVGGSNEPETGDPCPTETWLTTFFIWRFCNAIFIHFYTFAQLFVSVWVVLFLERVTQSLRGWDWQGRLPFMGKCHSVSQSLAESDANAVSLRHQTTFQAINLPWEL